MNQSTSTTAMLILILCVACAVAEFCEVKSIEDDEDILQHLDHIRHQKENTIAQLDKHDSDIRAVYGIREHVRYVEMFLVVDQAAYLKLGGDDRKVLRHCKNMVNILNAMTLELNIVVVLVGVEMWSDRDKIPNPSTDSLDEFFKYRKERLQPKHHHDHAQLLLGRESNSSVLGVAYVSTICHQHSVAVVRVEHANDAEVAQIMAHELGHSLSLQHDNATCCPAKKCIMAASSHNEWSLCSKNTWRKFQAEGKDNCLLNKPKSVFDGPDCGNGLLEQGEECDCGPFHFCNTSCCDARTCRLTVNATCATGPCCDTHTCQFLRGGSECRGVSDECDLPEFCSGNSELCPQDWYKADGEKCISDKVHANCSTRCHAQGVCNNAGHCHCDAGYAPPYCSGPGYGGSVDSGPTYDPTSNLRVITGVVIFASAFLMMSLLCLALLLFFKRQKSSNNKAKNPSKIFTLPVIKKDEYISIKPDMHATSTRFIRDLKQDNFVARPSRPPPPPPPPKLVPPTPPPASMKPQFLEIRHNRVHDLALKFSHLTYGIKS